MDNGFDFRWGIPALDDYGYAHIPGFILRHYSEAGVKPLEMMLITHLSAAKYNSPTGASSPSLTKIAPLMGYDADDQVRRMVGRLKKTGLLVVIYRKSDTSIYDFKPLTEACLTLEAASVPLRKSAEGGVRKSAEGGVRKSAYQRNRIEEIETQELKPSAATSAAPRVHDVIFDLIALRSWGIEDTTGLDKEGAALIGKLAGWVKEHYKYGPKHGDRDGGKLERILKELGDFYDWWAFTVKRSAIHDRAKFALHYQAWEKSGKPLGLSPQRPAQAKTATPPPSAEAVALSIAARARAKRAGGEQPPVLNSDDEAALDRAWHKVGDK